MSIPSARPKHRREKAKGKRKKAKVDLFSFASFFLPFVIVWFVGISAVSLVADQKLAQLKASVDNTTITIGDILQLNLEVKRPEASRVAFPTVGPQVKEWVVRDSVRPPAKEAEPGWASESLKLQLTIYKTGDFEVPPLDVE